MKLLHLIIHNIRFQFRHGFYLVYLIISLCYIAALHVLPEHIARKMFVLLIFSDISILGLFFIGAIIFLERDQGIMQTLFVTPLNSLHYIFSQVFSLCFLSLLMGLLIAVFTFRLSFSPFPLIVSIVTASILSTLTGIAIAVKQRRVTSYFVFATVIISPFFLPVLNYLQFTDIPLLQLLPATSILTLLEGTFKSVSRSDYITALPVLVVWSFAVTLWAVRRFDRYIIKKVGETG